MLSADRLRAVGLRAADRFAPERTRLELAALAAPMYDQTAAAGVVATLVLVLIVAAGVLTRRVAFAPAMRAPLVGVAAVVIFAPSAHGAADFIDARLAVLLAYLAFASLQGPSGGAGKTGTAVLAVALVVARVGLAAPHWAQYDGWAAAFRDAIRAVPPGARVLAVAPPAGRCPSLDAADFYRGWSISSSSTAARWRAPCHRTRHATGRRPRSAPRRDAVDAAPSRLARQPRLALALRHADRPARRLRLAAARIRPRPGRGNAASDDLPPALTPIWPNWRFGLCRGEFKAVPATAGGARSDAR